jgi:hypothetical protein
MHSLMKYLHLISAVFFTAVSLGICYADVPTAEEECRLRNSAICESGGVQFMADGPCPPTARIVRPQGRERCDPISPHGSGAVPMRQVDPQAVDVNAQHTDLAWVGRIERWLLPTLVLTGVLALVVGVSISIRRIRLQRGRGTTTPGPARSMRIRVIAGVISLLLAYHLAGFAFQRTFASFNNHDSAGPVLIAALVWFAAFLFAWPVAHFVIAFLLERAAAFSRQRRT